MGEILKPTKEETLTSGVNVFEDYPGNGYTSVGHADFYVTVDRDGNYNGVYQIDVSSPQSTTLLLREIKKRLQALLPNKSKGEIDQILGQQWLVDEGRKGRKWMRFDGENLVLVEEVDDNKENIQG